MADRCKFEKYQYQKTNDNGATWVNVVPERVLKGDILESPSTDCSEVDTIYRWVELEGTYICDGNNKYTKEMQEESYNGGATWYPSYPAVYQQGTFVGVDADYCCDKFVGHYSVVDTTCPRWYKWNGFKCVYVDPIKIVKCNDDSILRSGETMYYTSGEFSLISGEIGNSVTAIGNYAFQGYIYLSRVNSDTDGLFNIPTGITSIGDYAFNGCHSLTHITIPNGVTYIGEYAFRDCSGLTSVNIPTGVTTIHDSTFRDCVSLTSVTIPNGVTTIEKNAFISCVGLSSIELPSTITSIGDSAFTYSNNLTSITINATTPPTLGTNAFASTNNCRIYVPCSSADSYRSSWSDYSCRIYGIEPCANPSALVVKETYSNADDYVVEQLCHTSVGTGLTKPSGYDYTKMTSAELGEQINYIGAYAFEDCTALTSITINATTPPTLQTVGGGGLYLYTQFRNTNSCPIYVPCESFSEYLSTSAWTFNHISRLYPKPPCEIKYRGRYGGKYYIELCDSSTELTTASTKPSGYDYSYLYNVEIGNCITSFGSNVFDGCTRLSSITIGSGITSIGDYALRDCSGLTRITVNATTPPTLGSNALDNTNNCPIYVPCESVASYKLAWSNYSSRIYGEYPCMSNNDKFSALYSNSTVYVGECNNDPTLTMTDVRHGGNEYSSMTDATIGQCVTAIGNYAFSACTSLTSIEISNTVTSIGQRVFYGCSGLTSVAIPNSVTNIGEYAFANCSGLTSVTIGNGITSIGKGAFLISYGSSSSLQSITINASTPPTLGNDAFFRTNNCPIYVPLSSLNTYKNASGWSAYADRIQAIP